MFMALSDAPRNFFRGRGPSYKKSDFVIVKTNKSVLPSSDLNLLGGGGTDPHNLPSRCVTDGPSRLVEMNGI